MGTASIVAAAAVLLMNESSSYERAETTMYTDVMTYLVYQARYLK